MSLLILRDATLRVSGTPGNGISQTQPASACLHEPLGRRQRHLDQPEKNEFFKRLLRPNPSLPLPQRKREGVRGIGRIVTKWSKFDIK